MKILVMENISRPFAKIQIQLMKHPQILLIIILIKTKIGQDFIL